VGKRDLGLDMKKSLNPFSLRSVFDPKEEMGAEEGEKVKYMIQIGMDPGDPAANGRSQGYFPAINFPMVRIYRFWLSEEIGKSIFYLYLL
jgi:hypothetical protein